MADIESSKAQAVSGDNLVGDAITQSIRLIGAAFIAMLVSGTFMWFAMMLPGGCYDLIVSAEAYEGGDYEEAHDHKRALLESWGPEDGAERDSCNWSACLVTAFAFSLMLQSAWILNPHSEAAPRSKSLNSCFRWAFCGYICFACSPSVGLPAELPGMPAAKLEDRQAWWWGCVVLTAGGLFLMSADPLMAKKGEDVKMVWVRRVAAALGAFFILLPHIIGAPKPDDHHSDVPTGLGAIFAIRVLATQAWFWVSCTCCNGLAYNLLVATEPIPIHAGQA